MYRCGVGVGSGRLAGCWAIWTRLCNQGTRTAAGGGVSVNRHAHSTTTSTTTGHINLDQIFPEASSPSASSSDPSSVLRPTAEQVKLSPYVTFRSLMESRRQEAKRTLLVQVKGKESAEDLFVYCSEKFGQVKGMHFHRNPDNTSFSDFYLVEFESASSVRTAMEECRHHGDRNQTATVPVRSPFLWFTGTKERQKEGGAVVPVYLPVFHETPVNADEAVAKAEQKTTLSDQIGEFYRLSRMTDLSSRLRFLACQQVELALSGMFPQAEVLPFGSSVNSYGRSGSDLDMSVALDPASDSDPAGREEDGRHATSSRLIFHAKGGLPGNARQQNQRYSDQFSNLLQCFLPGCQNVTHIRHARVPIIQYQQQLLGLDCDLSIGSLSGHYMSELLYLYGELDRRVRPLVFVVRKWAREHGLIETARPTSFFTNFTLTVLVVFFLQHERRMLPSFRDLRRMARPADRVVCEDGVDCTFLRDVSGLQDRLNALRSSPEDPDHAALLLQFFRFYSSFHFDRHAVCALTGELQLKRGSGRATASKMVSYHMDATNPLEPDLNVSCNVQQYAVDKFQSECANSAEVVERMLQEDGDSAGRLSDLLSGGGPFKLKINIGSLDLGTKDEDKKAPSAKNRTGKRGNVVEEAEAAAAGVQLSKDKLRKTSSYQEEKKRQDDLKKSTKLKVKKLFRPKF